MEPSHDSLGWANLLEKSSEHYCPTYPRQICFQCHRNTGQIVLARGPVLKLLHPGSFFRAKERIGTVA